MLRGLYVYLPSPILRHLRKYHLPRLEVFILMESAVSGSAWNGKSLIQLLVR